MRYRIWYKKTLKQTGEPLMVQDLWTGTTINTSQFVMKGCDISISFNNAVGESKACGATTILEVFE